MGPSKPRSPCGRSCGLGTNYEAGPRAWVLFEPRPVSRITVSADWEGVWSSFASGKEPHAAPASKEGDRGGMDIPDQAATSGKQVLATATYALFLPSLVHMKQKPAAWVHPRPGVTIDEIVLHGTESNVSQVNSLDYLASKNGDMHSCHDWIGRDVGLLYALSSEDMMTAHAGNPDKTPGAQDHNPVRSASRCTSGTPLCCGRKNCRWISLTGNTTPFRSRSMIFAIAATSSAPRWSRMERSIPRG